MTYPLFRFALSSLIAAALLFGSAQAQGEAMTSDSVVVQAGDTAYSLSKKAGLTLEAFLSLNGLSSPDLKVGQTVLLRSSALYVVQPGDTLYSLARKYGLSVDALRAANDLSQESTIAIGQTLKIPAPGTTVKASSITPTFATVSPPPGPAVTVAPAVAVADPSETPAPQASLNWRENALSLIGTPYVYGGTTRKGIDCSGLVLQVFAPLGVKLPRVSADQARVGLPVEVNNLQAGDLVFFDTAGGGKVTHVGIYLGNDTFINANSYRGQVTVDHLLTDKYWAPRYLGARRVLTGNVLASQP